MVDNFTNEEAIAILAHEIGHIKKHHLWIRLLITIAPMPIMVIAGMLLDAYEDFAHVDIAVLPVIIVVIVFIIIYIGVITVYFSRIQEKQADIYALKLGTPKDILINSLLKIARLNDMAIKMNKVDEKFQTHPSIARRIKYIEHF